MKKEKRSPHVVCDVETNGPIYGVHSLVSFGLVIVEPELDRSFYGQMKPISEHYVSEALAVSGFSFGETLDFDDPKDVMERAAKWLEENISGRPIFWSDNNGFDAAWMNYYFHVYLGRNPFGHSSRRIADVICGLEKDLRTNWKHKRITKHTHDPRDDARGNAEAMLHYFQKHNIKYI